MPRYEQMTPAALEKVLRILVDREQRALQRAESASSASISRRAVIQAEGYTTRRHAVEQLLRAPLVH
jgi:CBS-domain-containing membrane protein